MASRRLVSACARWPSAPSSSSVRATPSLARCSARHPLTAQQQPLRRGLTTESIAHSSSDAARQALAQPHPAAAAAAAPVPNHASPSPPPPTPAANINRPYQQPQNPFLTTATCTVHDFPSLQPLSFVQYPGNHLLLPLRRDILHRAVVFEGDKTRQGTASTKWRSEVHGSNRKIRPQKGTGRARLGDKKSPMLIGGGVAFGPKPRDFSTDLPRKIYDLAWRTALSYRYRKGELVVLNATAEIAATGPGSARWLKDLLRWNKWGNTNGRSLFVTAEPRTNLYDALSQSDMGKEARALPVADVDVKDLLEMGRIVIEKEALDRILADHVSDLQSKVKYVV